MVKNGEGMGPAVGWDTECREIVRETKLSAVNLSEVRGNGCLPVIALKTEG